MHCQPGLPNAHCAERGRARVDAMIVVRDDLWLCVDCLTVAVNGDASGLDFSYDEEEAAAKLRDIEEGLEALGPHLVPDFDSETGDGHEEFANMGCDCCGSQLAGEMHRFAVLGEAQLSLPFEKETA